ncbi:ATP-dependent DNA ligase [Cryobacterium roopkundense]|uniref:DNA ligase (ATP) n=1 Tax=Cryobacterium roopkundense TaxID=1001240 RepID=A0A7W9E358_9MICO|nr:ATP-dependent DNA ligase [Cryobacterium roopkundense]MBB5640853.1 bifunctional non-homologous end joining protein LigD [Cryobacterium roopkundense]
MDPISRMIVVGGHRLTLTHLDKVLYPETGTTKADVLEYYATVADVLISHAAGRPATRKRWVHGVGTETDPEPAFFRKDLEPGAPAWIERRAMQHSSRPLDYPLVNDLATLVWLAQMSALEIHVPQWRFGRDGAPRHPDRLVLDLDPGPGVSLGECADVALILRGLLTGMGLDPVPVTSGSTGIHLYAALDMTATSDQVVAVAHELARAMAADHPDRVVSAMTKSVRAGRVFIDWSQNSAAKTTITPYSLRGRSRPTVAAPRVWSELSDGDLAQLDYIEVMRRVVGGGDPLARVNRAGGYGDPATAPPETRRHASASLVSPDNSTPHPLERYRAKRSAGFTPEPVPGHLGAALGRDTAPAFVVHEHHARRLHWDLRIERDGVLECWALPTGLPTSSAHNHLAVHTEAHPVDYRTFEGTIPAGQYGAGTMFVWDAGTVEVEKWGHDEVIVTLFPQRDGGLGGPRRFALIHTNGDGGADDNWLIHLMKTTAVAEMRATGTVPVTPDSPPPDHSPMLATTGSPSDLRPEREWAIEMKWDGIRILACVSRDVPEGTATLRTRNGLDATPFYPEVAAGVRAAVGSGTAVLDGEVVALDARGRPDFARLQSRMVSAVPPRPGPSPADPPVTYLVFDMLEYNGESLLDRGYDDRRRRLTGALTPQDSVQIPSSFDGDVAAAIRTSRELGLEGIVAKRHDSTYRAGRRSRAWVKVTQRRTQEVVIGGWRPGRGNRSETFGSLLLGIPHEGTLQYVGRVGTGFRDSDLLSARKLMDASPAMDCPFATLAADEAAGARWVRPELVGEVEFAQWTPAGRLRHPTWRGWRPDKSPHDVAREENPEAESIGSKRRQTLLQPRPTRGEAGV